jgi:hypothetical protein
MEWKAQVNESGRVERKSNERILKHVVNVRQKEKYMLHAPPV